MYFGLIYFKLHIGTFSITSIWRKISFRAWSRYRKIYSWIGSESWAIACCGLHWECNKEGNNTISWLPL